MTLLEWCAFIGAVSTVVALLGGGVYYRGRRDGVTDQRDTQNGEDKKSGTLSLEKLAAEAMDRDRRVTRLEVGFERHENGCEKAAAETKETLRRIEDLIEARYANLSQQIVNMARGEAGTFREIVPHHRPAE